MLHAAGHQADHQGGRQAERCALADSGPLAELRSRRCALATASLTRAGARLGEVVRSGEGGPDDGAELAGDGNAAFFSSDCFSSEAFSLASGAMRAVCFMWWPCSCVAGRARSCITRLQCRRAATSTLQAVST